MSTANNVKTYIKKAFTFRTKSDDIQKKQPLWERIKKSKTSYFMMLPFMLLFLLITVVPILISVILSFTSFDMLNWPSWIGLDNYKYLFLEDSIFLIVVKNTLVFAFLTGPVCYVISFVMAWFINEFSRGMRTFLTVIFYLPSLAGTAIYTIWQFIFSGDKYGFANSTLISLGITQEPIYWLTNADYILSVIIIIQIWLSLGAGFLSFVAGFQNADKEQYEAAAMDGVRNRFQELWYITLPAMAPQLMFAAVLQIGSSFGVGGIVTALAGSPTTNYSADTIITYLSDYTITRFEMGYASAIAVILFVAMLLVNYLITALLRRFSTD